MDLAKRFEEATAYATVNISCLDLNKLYPIFNDKSMTTKYGPGILLPMREWYAQIVQLFLSKRYCAVISDDDMDKFNTKAVSLNPVYKGLCESSKSQLLAIES